LIVFERDMRTNKANKNLFLLIILVLPLFFTVFLPAQTPDRNEFGYKVLDLEKECGLDIGEKPYLILDTIIKECLKKITPKPVYNRYDAIEILHTIGNTLGSMGIIYDTLKFYHEGLLKRRLDCKFYSFTYMTICERLNMPVFGVIVPKHMFIAWEDKKSFFFWEATGNGQRSQKFYVDSLKIQESAIKSGVFLSRFNLKQSMSVAYSNIGNYFLEKGNAEKAIELYSRAIAANAKFEGGYYNRAIAYQKADRYLEAMKDYDSVMVLTPSCSECYKYRGESRLKNKDYQGAISDLQTAIQRDSSDFDAYHNLGVAYWEQKKYEEAITYFTKSIARKPDYVSSYTSRAMAYEKMNMFKEAISDYNAAIKLEPNSDIVYYNRSLLYHKTEKYSEAIADLNRAIKLNPKDPDYYGYRADILLNLDQYKQAIDDYTTSLSIDPNKAEHYYNRSICYFKIKEDAKACDDLRKSYTLGYNPAKEYLDKNCK
jgi:tetratricopeptide (TPR) repeat protein